MTRLFVFFSTYVGHQNTINETDPEEQSVTAASTPMVLDARAGALLPGNPLTAAGGTTANGITPTTNGTAPKSSDKLIPLLGMRNPRSSNSNMVELKNLLQDKLKLEAPEYIEDEPRKTRRNQDQYRYTVRHQLLPNPGVQGNWCPSKQGAKQNAANKALTELYELYG